MLFLFCNRSRRSCIYKATKRSAARAQKAIDKGIEVCVLRRKKKETAICLSKSISEKKKEDPYSRKRAGLFARCSLGESSEIGRYRSSRVGILIIYRYIYTKAKDRGGSAEEVYIGVVIVRLRERSQSGEKKGGE